MCVLTRAEILGEIEKGRIGLEPFDPAQVGPASIDLHLGEELRVPEPHCTGPVHVTDEADPNRGTRLVRLDRPYVLEPGQTAHGVTRERLRLPGDLCAWIEGRSRIARFGLAVHITSGFIHPGVHNHQVLELSNVSGRPLALHAGVRICQIVVERTEGEAIYRGRFSAQTSP
jgi:dCTP deaminase